MEEGAGNGAVARELTEDVVNGSTGDSASRSSLLGAGEAPIGLDGNSKQAKDGEEEGNMVVVEFQRLR